jgi:hypothetical protein
MFVFLSELMKPKPAPSQLLRRESSNQTSETEARPLPRLCQRYQPQCSYHRGGLRETWTSNPKKGYEDNEVTHQAASSFSRSRSSHILSTASQTRSFFNESMDPIVHLIVSRNSGTVIPQSSAQL